MAIGISIAIASIICIIYGIGNKKKPLAILSCSSADNDYCCMGNVLEHVKG